MKQQEKSQKTRERILAAALTEFGRKSYEAASVNSICEAGQVSKGLLYHNFKSKDELYLHCVGVCYDRMTACMKEHASQSRNPRERLQNFLMVRQQFFAENPGLANIFFNTVLYPPRQLTEELALLRRDFDAYLEEEYRSILAQISLRDGISADMALEYFALVQEMFNGYHRRYLERGEEIEYRAGMHEEKLVGMVEVLLYGIAEKE